MTQIKLEEFAPGRWRVKKFMQNPIRARANLPMPHVISDTMPPTEQVDGKFYTSKRAFRAKGRELGLTEVGDQTFKPKQRASADPAVKRKRREALKKAYDRVMGV